MMKKGQFLKNRGNWKNFYCKKKFTGNKDQEYSGLRLEIKIHHSFIKLQG